MEVEAQEDGVLAKILVCIYYFCSLLTQAPNGAKDIMVNKPIAFLSDEGDDISNIEMPAEAEEQSKDQPALKENSETEAKSTPTDKPSSNETLQHGEVSFSKPAFPSVIRLAHEHGIRDPENVIEGTGPKGMLTKGDVLAYLGKAKSAFGTAKPHHTTMSEIVKSNAAGGAGGEASKEAPKKSPVSLTPDQQREMMMAGLVAGSQQSLELPKHASADDVLGSYGVLKPVSTAPKPSLNDVYASLLK